jgi:uncharacterized glyoxalase superfamily protein PhnB
MVVAMLRNRSVPVDTVMPHICYKDVPGAITWLTANFGFTEHFHYGAPISGAQMRLGNAFVMINSEAPKRRSPSELGFGTQSLTIFIEDVDAHYAHTLAAGSNVVEELNETGYGKRQYAVRDLEGHHWLFASHARDVSPDKWGATVVNPI